LKIRTTLVLGLGCAALLAPLDAGAAFTRSNSVKFTFTSLQPIEAGGIGCGSTAMGTFTPRRDEATYRTPSASRY